jgi:hypothetical protein
VAAEVLKSFDVAEWVGEEHVFGVKLCYEIQAICIELVEDSFELLDSRHRAPPCWLPVEPMAGLRREG